MRDKKVKTMKENETKNEHFYIWGVPDRGEEVSELLLKDKNALPIFNSKDCLLIATNENNDFEFFERRRDDAIIDLIVSNWTELKLPYKPKDKELVWCWDDDFNFERDLKFYDKENNTTFSIADGKRSGYPYDHYASYEGEYPDWAKEALKKLED